MSAITILDLANLVRQIAGSGSPVSPDTKPTTKATQATPKSR